jgi:hypothetical protein
MLPATLPKAENLAGAGHRKEAKHLICWLPGPNETANFEYSIPLRTRPKPEKMRKRDRDRAEARRLAGEPMLSLRERAVAFARKRGVVRTRDLMAIGIPRCYLARMCDEGLLVKVAYGLYCAAEGKVA